jgi:hypothetical protein
MRIVQRHKSPTYTGESERDLLRATLEALALCLFLKRTLRDFQEINYPRHVANSYLAAKALGIFLFGSL